MILFKDVYKSANDSINPPPELIDKVLKQKPRKQLYYYNAVKIAAVCLIFSGTVLMYPKISQDLDTTTKENIIQPDVIETAIPDIASVGEVPADIKPETVATPVPTPQITKKPAAPRQEVNIKASEKEIDEQKEEIISENAEIFLEENNTLDIAAETAATESAYTPDESQPEASSGGGGGSSGGGAVFRARTVMISEKEAVIIADAEFLSDFGKDFIENSELTVIYDNGYTVTRKTIENEASICVADDGSFEKLY